MKKKKEVSRAEILKKFEELGMKINPKTTVSNTGKRYIFTFAKSPIMKDGGSSQKKSS